MTTSEQTRVLYCGDDTLSQAASYLAGVMEHTGIAFDHRESNEDARELLAEDSRYACYVLSDYPARRLGGYANRILEAVAGGSGLLMIGGWDSYRGAGGAYDSSPIAEALPVEIGRIDDRMNWYGPCVVRKVTDHPICDGLDFDPAPTVAGFNAVRAKRDAEVILEVDRYAVSAEQSRFVRTDSHPLLVCGSHGDGRTAAFTSDVAPHWVGGLVDWGDERISVETEEYAIEVGDRYVRFLSNLLHWLLAD